MTLFDYNIVIIYIVSVFYLGVKYRDRSSDFSNFMIAGRKVGLSLGVATMLHKNKANMLYAMEQKNYQKILNLI